MVVLAEGEGVMDARPVSFREAEGVMLATRLLMLSGCVAVEPSGGAVVLKVGRVGALLLLLLLPPYVVVLVALVAFSGLMRMALTTS